MSCIIPLRGTKVFQKNSSMTDQLCFFCSFLTVVRVSLIPNSCNLPASLRLLPTYLHVLLCVKWTHCPSTSFFQCLMFVGWLPSWLCHWLLILPGQVWLVGGGGGGGCSGTFCLWQLLAKHDTSVMCHCWPSNRNAYSQSRSVMNTCKIRCHSVCAACGLLMQIINYWTKIVKLFLYKTN